MKLFEFKDWTLNVREECWGLSPFNKILKRDKSKSKELALKEMLFIYFYTDIKSDYLIISNLKDREEEIKKDINLPKDWKIDKTLQEAIDMYESKTMTPVGKLYKSSLKAADDISNYLESTDVLLKERTDKGGVVTPLTTITSALKSVPGIMRDLKAAYKEVVAEQKEMEGRTKGSRTLGMFEDGL